MLYFCGLGFFNTAVFYNGARLEYVVIIFLFPLIYVGLYLFGAGGICSNYYFIYGFILE